MKKRGIFLRAWVLALAAGLSLTACAAPAESAAAEPEVQPEVTAVPEAEPDTATIGNLIMIPSTCGGYWGWNTGEAYYEIARIYDGSGTSMKAQVLRTDYATGVQSVYCSVPGCTHDSTSCPAYLENWARTDLLVLDGTVYLLYQELDKTTRSELSPTREVEEERLRGFYDDPESIEEGLAEYELDRTRSFVEKLDPAQQGRTRIVTLADDAPEEINFRFCDENAVYGPSIRYSDSDPTKLYRWDLTDGTLQEFPLLEQETLQDCRNGKFLTAHMVSDAPIPQFAGEEERRAMLQNAVQEYDWYDPITGEREKVCDRPYYDDSFVTTYDGKLYFMSVSDADTNPIYSMLYFDPAVGEMQTLVEELSKFTWPGNIGRGFCPQFGDKQMPYITLSDLDYHSWIMDLRTGAIEDFAQKQSRDGMTLAVDMMAETNDGRWLIGYKPHSSYHNDRCDYGFIDPQDFLNGSESYDLVEMYE